MVIKDKKGNVTYYAFTPSQARFIMKVLTRDQISTKLVDSLDSVVKSYQELSVEHTNLIDSLASTNTKFYKIKVLAAEINQKTTRIEEDYIQIVNGKEAVIQRRNKLLRLLVVSNVVSAALLVLLLL